MDAYFLDAATAVAQVVVVGAVLFVVVPWLALEPRSRRPFGPRLTDHAAAAVVAVGLLVPLLSLLDLFDGASLAAAVAAIALAAAHRRGDRPREALRRVWRRATAAALDLAEGARARRRRVEPWRAVAAWTGGRRMVLLGAVALAAVVLWVELAEAVVHAGPDLAGHGVRVQRLNALALNRPFGDGVHHLGIESVLAALRRVVSVDAPLLVRLAPGLEGVALVVGVVWAGWRVTDRAAAGLVGGAFVALAAHAPWWPLAREATSDTLAIGAAAVFVAPALAAAFDARRGRSGPWPVALHVAAVALLHPLVGALVAGALLAGWLVTSAVDRSADRRLALGIVVGAGTGWLPIGLGLAAGEPLTRGPFGIEAAIGPAFREITRLPPDVGRPHLLLVAALAVAVLGVVRGPAPMRLLGGAALVLVTAVQPYRLGIDDPLAPGIGAIVATGALGLGVAAVVRLLPLRPVALVTIAVAIALASLPLPDAVSARERKDDLAGRIREIDRRHPPFGWTVVAEPAALTQVPADGFFVDGPTFVDRYDPVAWRYDPEQPDLSLPTRHVYVFVPLTEGAAVVNETAGEAAALGFDDLSAGSTVVGTAALARWIRTYQQVHDDVRVAWRDDHFVVYQITRSREEEDVANDAAQVAREERREAATRCRAVGDFLLFPTPEAFEVCE